MPRPQPAKGSQRTLIMESLVRQIRGGALKPGTRLPSLRDQARSYNTSLATVQDALNMLASEGYVEKQHGRGTFVRDRLHELRLSESVVLCIETRGHLFSDVCQALIAHLHDQGKTALIVDTTFNASRSMLESALASDASFIVVHGSKYFPFNLLAERDLTGKHVISIIEAETGLLGDQMHRILVDHREGARLMVDHLRQAGCRHVLALAPASMIAVLERHDLPAWIRDRCAFIDEWRMGGGTWELQAPIHAPVEKEMQFPVRTGYQLDEERLIAAVEAAEPPVGIAALLDALGFDALQVLRRRAPELLAKVRLIGYGNTPWSQIASPPYSSVDWSLDPIAQGTSELIQRITMGDPPATPLSIKFSPRLIDRSTNPTAM